MERQEAALLSEKRRLDNGETLAVPPATDVLSAATDCHVGALRLPGTLGPAFLGGIAANAQGKITGRAAAAVNAI
jgi:hypothetical protein